MRLYHRYYRLRTDWKLDHVRGQSLTHCAKCARQWFKHEYDYMCTALCNFTPLWAGASLIALSMGVLETPCLRFENQVSLSSCWARAKVFLYVIF